MSAAILAGGKSSRMGEDKSFLRLGDQTLVEIAAANALVLTPRVTVLSDARKHAHLPHLADLHTGCGPLGGIETALRHASTAWTLFLAVDTPFIPVTLLRVWIENVVNPYPNDCTRRCVASALTQSGRLHPLPLILHRSALPVVQSCLGSANLAVGELLRRIEAVHPSAFQASRAESYAVSSDILLENWFLNLNRPEDHEAAAALLHPSESRSHSRPGSM